MDWKKRAAELLVSCEEETNEKIKTEVQPVVESRSASGKGERR